MSMQIFYFALKNKIFAALSHMLPYSIMEYGYGVNNLMGLLEWLKNECLFLIAIYECKFFLIFANGNSKKKSV